MIYRPEIHHLPKFPLHHPVTDWRNGVLIRATNWLGDALMTRPAAYKIKQLLPAGCPLAVLTPKGLAGLWEACEWCDLVIPFAGHHPDRETCDLVSQKKFGLAIVFPNSFGSAWDIWKTHIPRRLGRRGRWRSLLLTDTIPEWPRSKESAAFHQLSYYLQLAETLAPAPDAIAWDDACPSLKVDLQTARNLGITDGEDWLALAPGAAYGPAKQWPDEYFGQVAQWHVKNGGRVVLVGTPKEQRNAQSVLSTCPVALDLTGKTSLPQLLAVLAAVRAVVANDSGAMHLAAAVGTPGVAIFGSTDPVATGPLGAPWHLLVPDIDCRPCFARTCQLTQTEKQYACLRQTTPQAVIDALQKLV